MSKETSKQASIARISLGWFGDIREKLVAPEGWMLLGKASAVVIGILGLLLTWVALHANSQGEEIRRAQEARREVFDSLSSPVERTRVVALAAIPELMRRQVPATPRVSIGEALLSLLGWSPISERTFREPLKRQLIAYLKSGWDGSGVLSPSESREVWAVLEQLDGATWFGDSHRHRLERAGLRWIWDIEPMREDSPWSLEAANELRNLLSDCYFHGLTLDGHNLDGANFRRSTLKEVSLVGARLNAADLSASTLVSVDLLNAQLRRAKIDAADIRASKLDGTAMNGLSARGTQFFGSYIARIDLSALPSSDRQADLSRASFIDCVISDITAPMVNLAGISISGSEESFIAFGAPFSDFRGADLRGAHLDGGNYNNTQFDEADLRGAYLRNARLSFASFSGSRLDNADLSGADLRDAEGWTAHDLKIGRGPASLTGLNIHAARGLSAEARRILLERGATDASPDPLKQ